MKKQLLFLFVCFSLLTPGSIFITGLNAQTPAKKTARTPTNQSRIQKTSSSLKSPSVQKIARNRKTENSNVGDPCLETAPITVGQTVNGNLAVTDCQLEDGTLIDFYSFNGTAGQPIFISMNSAAFDTYLYLLDDTGEIIEENDDTGTGTNSRIPIDGGVITLPYTGEYIIGANQFDPATGAYSLTLGTSPACAATPIAYNQTVNGTLASTDCAVNIAGEPFYTDIYTFNGTAGQQISIAMNSAAVNSYLILHTPSGTGSVDDDDSGGGENARIPVGSGLFTLPQTGTYTIEASSFDSFEVGAYTLVLTGPTIVVPTANKLFDYDGDGKSDLSVFRPSTGTWYIQNSGTANTYNIQNFGVSSDTIAPADFDGDGKTDIAVFRASEGSWYVLNSSNNSASTVNFGVTGDIPVPGDFDGDDKADYAVFRPSTSTWWILRSSNRVAASVNFGVAGDKPVSGDFDGDGKNDVAIFRPSTGTWWILQSSNNVATSVNFGVSTDLTTPADFDGDGKTDIAVYRASEATWYILNSSNNSVAIVNFGVANDKPVAADYDGDGKADIAVFRPSDNTWYLLQSTAGFGAQVLGSSGDIPTPNAFVR